MDIVTILLNDLNVYAQKSKNNFNIAFFENNYQGIWAICYTNEFHIFENKVFF